MITPFFHPASHITDINFSGKKTLFLTHSKMYGIFLNTQNVIENATNLKQKWRKRGISIHEERSVASRIFFSPRKSMKFICAAPLYQKDTDKNNPYE